jgi:4-hydroxy-tetrahydrodipicolinate reductase
MSAIRVHVHGAGGRMGGVCVAAVRAESDLVLCGQSGRDDDLRAVLARTKPDVVVEFTVAAAALDNLHAILDAGCHGVSGTTGLEPNRVRPLDELARARGRGLLLAPNFALGMVLLQRFARAAAAVLRDVEIVELHHDGKRDAPSGTALHTARQITAAAGAPLNASRPAAQELLAGCRGGLEAQVPIHSIRLPGLMAHQEVIFGAPGQVLTLRHDTLDRQAYAPGVLLAIRRIRERSGLIESLEDLLPC